MNDSAFFRCLWHMEVFTYSQATLDKDGDTGVFAAIANIIAKTLAIMNSRMLPLSFAFFLGGTDNYDKDLSETVKNNYAQILSDLFRDQEHFPVLITAVFKIKWDTNAHCKILMF